MKGKILANSSAIDRSKTDFYATPKEVTYALMDYLNIKDGFCWEPACGKGDMSKILEMYFDGVESTDLYDGSYGQSGIDFTKEGIQKSDWIQMGHNFDWIITNPPFKNAEQFIRVAWSTGIPFALLLKSQYWHAKSRTKLFKECKPSHVLALNWRPDFLHGLKGGAPTMECIWVVWDRKSDHTIYDILVKNNG